MGAPGDEPNPEPLPSSYTTAQKTLRRRLIELPEGA
jgi:hypothetical protein